MSAIIRRGYFGVSRSWVRLPLELPAVPSFEPGASPPFFYYIDAWRIGQPSRKLDAKGPVGTAWPLTEPYNAFDSTARARPGAFVRQWLWDSYSPQPSWTLRQARFA